ncbi:putative ribonuclease H-like domain-containing protein [Tanacetum coccineum]
MRSGPHETQYCIEDPKQAFVEYASSRTDEAGVGLVSSFMASQNARLSKFEADFKHQQSEMTKKIDTVLKVITDRIAGKLPSDTVKNLKMSTSPVLSARSYPTIDPQYSSYISISINAIKTCSMKANISQTSQPQTGMGIGTQQPEKPEPTLKDEFQDLHLNLPVLEVLAHALIYNAIFNKYVKSLELGKNGSVFVQGKVSTKIEDPRIFTLPYMWKPKELFFDMKNIVPNESLTCLVAKATLDESMLWHRRLGHINFKNINKLVKDNLVRGLPTKRFENDQTCVACLKGKQHRASCKSKVMNPITKPLFMLHTDLFGPTFVSSLMHKKYCLVVTDDYSRFTWVFFLTTKDETSEILKNFIKEIENLVDKKVKIIRCDNGTKFKNKVMDDFCREKGIRREYSIARTPQQNGVAERRNRTLIEAARTMLADSKLRTTFWAEVVSTAYYV